MNACEDRAGRDDLLARWRAFSELQQRAFSFLAAEAIATGLAFENSTEGAAQVLGRMGEAAQSSVDPDHLRAETFSVIHRLQAADRSRQGLEQVAAVLDMLRRLEADLTEETLRHGPLPAVDRQIEEWTTHLGECVTLSDWRRRFHAALRGGAPESYQPGQDSAYDEELFL